MNDSTEFSPYSPDALPSAVARYLRGAIDDRPSTLDAFAPNARITDEGRDHEGIDAVRDWLNSAGSEYTYTTTYLGQRADRPDRWVIRTRIEGDFPGGVADLRYRFTLDGDRIAELVIAP